MSSVQREETGDPVGVKREVLLNTVLQLLQLLAIIATAFAAGARFGQVEGEIKAVAAISAANAQEITRVTAVVDSLAGVVNRHEGILTYAMPPAQITAVPAKAASGSGRRLAPGQVEREAPP